MELRIHGHDLPGRGFTSEGVPLGNVHVGLQLGREPADLVPADAPSADWSVDVDVLDGDDGHVDVRGRAVQGRRGERFVYLTWGEVTSDGSFEMFRRAKLMIADIGDDLLRAAARSGGALAVSVGLTDARGGPRCARVRLDPGAWVLVEPGAGGAPRTS